MEEGIRHLQQSTSQKTTIYFEVGTGGSEPIHRRSKSLFSRDSMRTGKKLARGARSCYTLGNKGIGGPANKHDEENRGRSTQIKIDWRGTKKRPDDDSTVGEKPRARRGRKNGWRGRERGMGGSPGAGITRESRSGPEEKIRKPLVPKSRAGSDAAEGASQMAGTLGGTKGKKTSAVGGLAVKSRGRER